MSLAETLSPVIEEELVNPQEVKAAKKCPKPEGKRIGYKDGTVYELQDQAKIYDVIKKGPDQSRVITRNLIVAIEDADTGDEVWVVPMHPGKEDRTARYRLMWDDHVEISLFNGKETTLEFELNSGKRKTDTLEESNMPEILPKKAINEIITTMATLVQGQTYELAGLQSFINIPRTFNLEH